MNRLKKAVTAVAVCAWTALTPALLFAQGRATDIGGLRAYWHVFIAYTIAIALVLGWVISIGRRLREVEERLDN